MSPLPTPPRTRTRHRIPGVSNVERASQPSGEINLPPQPTTENRTLRDEQQVYRAERLMLQGLCSPRELMPLLGVQDRRQMERFIKRVEAIWEIQGRKTGIETERGKAIREYERLTSELWKLWGQSNSIREKGAIIETLMRLRDKKNAIHGITRDQIEKLTNQSDIPESVLRSIAKQEELVDMFRMFAQLVDEETENPTPGLNRIAVLNPEAKNNHLSTNYNFNCEDNDDEDGDSNSSSIETTGRNRRTSFPVIR